MNKKTRETVYGKYNGHCAYCGKELTMGTMQVDHIDPKRRYADQKIADRIENLNPSCSRCNHYKRSGDIEYLRKMLLNMQDKVIGTYLGKVAVDYGMVEWNGWDGKFYFEKSEPWKL